MLMKNYYFVAGVEINTQFSLAKHKCFLLKIQIHEKILLHTCPCWLRKIFSKTQIAQAAVVFHCNW